MSHGRAGGPVRRRLLLEHGFGRVHVLLEEPTHLVLELERALAVLRSPSVSPSSRVREQLDRGVEQHRHGGPEMVEALAHRLAREVAVVDPLGHHGELEVAERDVPVEVG